MGFNNRFTQVIDNQCGGNKKKFSELTKIPYTTVIDYANSLISDPKISLIKKITESIPDINLQWLLYGKGEMLAAFSQNDIDNESLKREIGILKELLNTKNDLITQLKLNIENFKK